MKMRDQTKKNLALRAQTMQSLRMRAQTKGNLEMMFHHLFLGNLKTEN